LEDLSKPSSRYFGFKIKTAHPGERADAGIIVLYTGLSRQGEYQGVPALAVNPWMVFRSNTSLPLSRSRAETAGEGSLYLAGRDSGSLAGWTAQLLQERPGVFPPWGERWTDTAKNLIQNRHFQQGALTYSWGEIWPRIINTPSAWVYAPLAAAQRLPGHQLSLIEADRFPEKEDWNVFSLQAQVLWAVPFGAENKQSRDKLLTTGEWLGKVETQSSLAADLGWIPARSEGKPYNPVALSAQLAWLASSYIWEAELPAEARDY
jgi:hypothetical protein